MISVIKILVVSSTGFLIIVKLAQLLGWVGESTYLLLPIITIFHLHLA